MSLPTASTRIDVHFEANGVRRWNVAVDVDGVDPRSLGGEALDDGSTDPACRTTDERGASVKHHASPGTSPGHEGG